eukprot:3326346-Lingulodinium_polyedra.AAC.1
MHPLHPPQRPCPPHRDDRKAGVDEGMRRHQLAADGGDANLASPDGSQSEVLAKRLRELEVVEGVGKVRAGEPQLAAGLGLQGSQ